MSGFLFFFDLTLSLDSTDFAQAYNIVLPSFISSSISVEDYSIVKLAKLRYFSCDFFIFTFARFSGSVIQIASVFPIPSIILLRNEVYSTSLFSF